MFSCRGMTCKSVRKKSMENVCLNPLANFTIYIACVQQMQSRRHELQTYHTTNVTCTNDIYFYLLFPKNGKWKALDLSCAAVSCLLHSKYFSLVAFNHCGHKYVSCSTNRLKQLHFALHWLQNGYIAKKYHSTDYCMFVAVTTSLVKFRQVKGLLGKTQKDLHLLHLKNKRLVGLVKGWRTCGPQKKFVRPAKHSGEASSLELSHSGDTTSLELTGFILWTKCCAASLLSGNS